MNGQEEKIELTLQERAALDSTIERYKRQASQYRRLYNSLVSRQASVENIIELMKDTLSTVPNIAPPVQYPPSGTMFDEEECLLLFSDSQIGQKQIGAELGLETKEIYGALGDYNIDVFRYRLRLWLKGVLKIISVQRRSIPVRKLNLWFLGDVLENEIIFPAQGSYIETGLMGQFFVALYEIAQVISVLASNFETVEIHCTYGN